MTIKKWLQAAEDLLKEHGVTTARLDTLVLLEDQIAKDRSWILAYPESDLNERDENVLNGLIVRRAEHVPLAYLRGKTEFYGREFVVSEAVLEPRPESETMIDLLKELISTAPAFGLGRHAERVSAPRSGDHGPSNGKAVPKLVRHDTALRKNSQTRPIRVADVGTGSGAIGISAALEVPDLEVDLLEIDDAAIKIAKLNVVRHATANRVIKSDLLANSGQDYDILLCNLPYVPDDFQINTAASHEPKVAIFGGPDGLDLYRKLFQQIEYLKYQPLYILIEILPFQKTALLDIAQVANYQLIKADDFIHVFSPVIPASKTESKQPR